MMTLDERERAAYIAGDTATAALCVQAIEGSDDAEGRIDATQALLDAWPGDLLGAILHYAQTYLEEDAVQGELLDLIERTQADLDERIDALRDTLC
jgi:hypothetical protein